MSGAGGHAEDLRYLSECDKYSKWNIIGYLDDNDSLKKDNIIGNIIHLNSLLEKYKNLKYTIAVNSSSVRRGIEQRINRLDRAANLIHETAIIGSSCSYKNGLTMGPYSCITTRVYLGYHVHLNTLASINQSSTVGDYCTISPGAKICGDVFIGDTTSVGAGAVVINYKTIGANCTLGAGTVVIDNIEDGTTVVGVPGRSIKKNGEYI